MTSRSFLSIALAVVATIAAFPTSAAAAPSDPQAAQQEPLRIMRVSEALDRIARPLADVPVLVADTGLDLDHPDIAPRLYSLPAPVAPPDADGVGNLPNVAAGAPGWDLIGTTAPGVLAPDPDPSDPAGGSGHGTEVAGLLGATWNNGVGGAGVAPNARFVALRTCWDGDDCYQYVQAAAIDWAAARGTRVASFSWLSGALEPDLEAAIRNHPEVLFVTIPSGNGGAVDADPDDPQPCALNAPNVLCVSTSAPDGGLDCGGYGAKSVDIAVPTRNSVTTVNGGGFGPTACATSYAAPTAAGVATILFGIDPTALPTEVKAAIIDSARPAGAWAGKSVSGGVVDAAAAVELFQQRRGIAGKPVDSQPPQLTAKRAGKKLKLTLSEPASVKVIVQRRLAGRRVGGTCRKPSPARRGAKRCARWVTVAVLHRANLGAGSYSLQLPSRNGRGRKLPAGAYRALVVATDPAGNSSPQRRVPFRIGG